MPTIKLSEALRRCEIIEQINHIQAAEALEVEVEQLRAIAPIGWQRNLKDWQEAVAVWRARAEKAEARVAVLEKALHTMQPILEKRLPSSRVAADFGHDTDSTGGPNVISIIRAALSGG